MSKREALLALRTALLRLYNNPTSIRRLVDDAGVEAGLVNFQGPAQDIMHSVLTEAESQDCVDALVKAVDPAYQNNKALQQAYQAYVQANNNNQASSSPTTPPPGGTQITINTGGGTYIAGNVNTGGGDFVGRDRNK